MYFSINILKDALEGLSFCSYFPESCEREFQMISTLPYTEDEISAECLYVCPLSRAIEVRHRRQDLAFLCLRDRFKDEKETYEVLTDMIVVSENIALEDLFSLVQREFLRINKWLCAMQKTIVDGGNLQDLLDLSEPIFGNTIDVSDSALALLACTKNIETSNRVSQLLRKYGYHPNETIERFKESCCFERWLTAPPEVTVRFPDETEPMTHLARIFKFNNVYFMHVVMFCDHHPYTPGQKELFSLLADHLFSCAVRGSGRQASAVYTAEVVLTNILGGLITHPEDIENCAHMAGLPVKSTFTVLVSMPLEVELEAVINGLRRELNDLYPNAWTLLHNHYMITLLCGTNMDAERLEILLRKYNASCGVSLPFTGIQGIKDAFEQALMALTYSRRDLRDVPLPNDGYAGQRISCFRDGCAYYLLKKSEGGVRLWRQTYYGAVLRKLHEYDQKHHTNRLGLLDCYLRCERSASETGKIMHMNRNNVTYHIRRIEEEYTLRLDDSLERFNLQTAYAMLRMYGFHSE